MLFHAAVQAFQADVQNIGVVGAWYGAEIPHQLCGCLGNKGTLFSKFFRIYNSMIAVVRRGQSWELFRMGHPVKVPGVYNGAAHTGTMSVHVFCGRVGYNIRSPLERAAVDGCGKSIVYNQGYAMCMRRF